MYNRLCCTRTTDSCVFTNCVEQWGSGHFFCITDYFIKVKWQSGNEAQGCKAKAQAAHQDGRVRNIGKGFGQQSAAQLCVYRNVYMYQKIQQYAVGANYNREEKDYEKESIELASCFCNDRQHGSMWKRQQHFCKQ